MPKLALETLEHLRGLPSREVFDVMRQLAFRSGGGSDHYGELMQEMVEQGLLTRDEIEMYEDAGES